ncbi:MAG: haloacid dehalogenase [Pirellulaceae bacterium]|nr:MAG: haloacid dehalogenase [Pirellulaceae bacterium]
MNDQEVGGPGDAEQLRRAARIRYILCDVDGVLTDGRLQWTEDGKELKSFHVRDGLGIKLWQGAGHGFGILTARSSPIVTRRAAELGIAMVRQGCEEKLPAAQEIVATLSLTPQHVCYIGDDLPDIPVMRWVGLAVTVADGADEAKRAAHWITQRAGGCGAVREAIEWLLTVQGRWPELLPPQGSRVE